MELSILRKKGYSLRNIGEVLGVSAASVSRELRRNSNTHSGEYEPSFADHKAYAKRKYSKYEGMKICRDDGLDKNIVDRINIFIKASNIRETDESVLIHGDLHANNALIKDQNIILFDKGDQIVAGDPMYDLALVAINLPGAIYKLGTQIEKDIKLLEAFIEGYGIDFTSDTQKLETYILLRALERWPNPFENELPDIINTILSNK